MRTRQETNIDFSRGVSPVYGLGDSRLIDEGIEPYIIYDVLLKKFAVLTGRIKGRERLHQQLILFLRPRTGWPLQSGAFRYAACRADNLNFNSFSCRGVEYYQLDRTSTVISGKLYISRENTKVV